MVGSDGFRRPVEREVGSGGVGWREGEVESSAVGDGDEDGDGDGDGDEDGGDLYGVSD